MSSSDKHKIDAAWNNNCFLKNFDACWRENAKLLLFYCGTIQYNTIQYNLLNSSNKRACSNRFVNVTIVSSK